MTREAAHPSPATPRRHLAVAHATVLALGMIMTTDTLKTAPTVALNIGAWHFYGFWILGGLLSMVGAMCYVEMASAFPDAGGDYSFLRRAYGPTVGLLFAWSRFSIMHTGWIALMAFMLADYVDALLHLGHLGRTGVAAGIVVLLVGLNRLHVRVGFLTQAGLVVLVALGFASVVAAAVTLEMGHRSPPAMTAVHAAVTAPSLAKVSVALIYIFLAYGGWSDAATLSAEIRNDRRGMLVTIIGSIAALMAIYLALNAALLIGLGPDGLAHSTAPAADLLRRAFGPAGAALIVVVVAVSAVASINSTLIVGARTTWAAARDVPALSRLAIWDGARGAPARAVTAEGVVAVALIAVGSFAASGFNAMVDYMTPVYWFFMALSVGAVLVLRWRYPDAPRPVKTPLYPLFPAAFLMISLYMLAASLVELGLGALMGAGVMALGAGVIAVLQRWGRRPGALSPAITRRRSAMDRATARARPPC